MSRFRAWLRERERRREVAEARWALEIFGVGTEGLSESELVRSAEELDRRIAEEWRAIENADC